MTALALAPTRTAAPLDASTSLSRVATHAPELTVVVPTRNEAESVSPLLDELEPALAGIDAEVLFVDDSDDGTPAAIAHRAAASVLPIRVVHRPAGERGDGLGGAVVLGLGVARGEYACIMDGDLQHPPAVVRDLLAEAKGTGSGIVVASRYCNAGSTGDFGAARQALSMGSTRLAQVAFPRALGGITDPMSGFFLVRRSEVDASALRPHGFKILLEILVRSGATRSEVPFRFGERQAGESKASYREGMRYLRHLARLRAGDQLPQLARFGAVGVSGIAVNSGVLAGLTDGLGVFYLMSALVALQVSILWNFALTEAWVFGHRRSGDGRGLRAVTFMAINNLAFAAAGPLLVFLVSVVGMGYLLANLAALALLTLARYSVSERFIWSSRAVA